MISSLLYLTTSRLDVMFSVYLCARFQYDPRDSHLSAVKRIFRYLVGTSNLNLMYKHSDSYKLTGYCVADYAGDKVERKNTSRRCHFIGRSLIS